jgi:AmpD protein
VKLEPATGLIAGARFVASPNQDARPRGAKVEALIVHCISLPPGRYGGRQVERFFLNRLDAGEHPYFRAIADLKVSAHFYIRRGGTPVQFVPTHRRAWHAGVSRCLGRERVNDFSIGVELEGTDDSPFTDAQYRTLGRLTRALVAAYPALNAQRLFGHSDIAPGRKSDPGPHFDWERYRRGIPAAS